ncbi:MAG: hypothetical protein AMS14_09720 [Planctomycetes bacterium DG_20]|nr:MAG: hypothetical protein AMS14_09720 [Planctomycetes bacterium DG_20]
MPTPMPASMAAPRGVASSICGTSTGTPDMSALFCIQKVLRTAPPTATIRSAVMPRPPSTARRISRNWYPSPSKTARIISPFVVLLRRPTNAPRDFGSTTGHVLPERCGRKSVPPAPGGAALAAPMR